MVIHPLLTQIFSCCERFVDKRSHHSTSAISNRTYRKRRKRSRVLELLPGTGNRSLISVRSSSQYLRLCCYLNCSLYFMSLARCPDCKFPLCSAKCSGRDHSKAECQFFTTHNLHKHLHWQAHKSELEHDYEAITVLR